MESKKLLGLLNDAIVSVPLLSAPTEYDAAKIAGGSLTVEQLDPSLPAETTVMIPAAR